jgi:hypothetical protein
MLRRLIKIIDMPKSYVTVINNDLCIHDDY